METIPSETATHEKAPLLLEDEMASNGEILEWMLIGGLVLAAIIGGFFGLQQNA